jgi:PAS domain S-box-containing protein
VRQERHDAFLVHLDDAVRPLEDPRQITQVAARLLGEHLGVNRCAYADVEDDQDTFNLTGDYNRGVPSIVGRYRFAQFGAECLRLMREGLPYIVEDSESDPRTLEVRESYRMTLIRSVVCVSLRKAGRFVAAMAVHQTAPRAWRFDEVDLLQTVANRCWESIERARVSRALAESEGRFRQLADAMPQIVWVTDEHGYHGYYNQRWYEYTGQTFEETKGEGWNKVFHPDDRERAWQLWSQSLETGEPYEIEYRARRHDGAYRWLLGRALPVRDDQGRIVKWFGTCTDIEDQKRAADLLEQRVQERTEQLRRSQVALAEAQKMEAVGRLAGGVAHDFNNMLTGVLGIIEETREALGADSPYGRDLNDAVAALHRASELTRQLLAFGRRQVHTPRPLSLNELVQSMNQIFRRLIGEDIKVQMLLDENLSSIQADPSAMEQVILNLVLNARDAMPNGGTLTIETSNVVLGDEYVRRHFDVRPGPHVLLAIRDTGTGMNQNTIAHIFEPYFTTKEVGKGTGLGLATVYGIVKQAGGDIQVESEPGRGSMFCIYLPRIAETAQPAEAPAAQTDLEGGERIFVVEDEEIVRRVAVRALRKAGYEVCEAKNGAEALKLFEDCGRVDLLLTDVVMPGINGHELARRLRERYPNLVVLYMSGYSEDIIAHKGLLQPNLPFIEKSFSAKSLCAKVREVLDGSPVNNS